MSSSPPGRASRLASIKGRGTPTRVRTDLPLQRLAHRDDEGARGDEKRLVLDLADSTSRPDVSDAGDPFGTKSIPIYKTKPDLTATLLAAPGALSEPSFRVNTIRAAKHAGPSTPQQPSRQAAALALTHGRGDNALQRQPVKQVASTQPEADHGFDRHPAEQRLV